MKKPIDDTEIRRRAHALWEQEGRPEGRADAHWAVAKAALEAEAAAPAAVTDAVKVPPARSATPAAAPKPRTRPTAAKPKR